MSPGGKTDTAADLNAPCICATPRPQVMTEERWEWLFGVEVSREFFARVDCDRCDGTIEDWHAITPEEAKAVAA